MDLKCTIDQCFAQTLKHKLIRTELYRSLEKMKYIMYWTSAINFLPFGGQAPRSILLQYKPLCFPQEGTKYILF